MPWTMKSEGLDPARQQELVDAFVITQGPIPKKKDREGNDTTEDAYTPEEFCEFRLKEFCKSVVRGAKRKQAEDSNKTAVESVDKDFK